MRPLALEERLIGFPLAVFSFLTCWCGATFLVSAFLIPMLERGPALPARLPAGVPGFGVPGPMED